MFIQNYEDYFEIYQEFDDVKLKKCLIILIPELNL